MNELNKKLAKQASYYGTPEQKARIDAEVLAEKNEKLAEWAGFACAQSHYTEDPTRIIWDGWNYPDGTVGQLPHFTESLDACFKWLVPKLEEWSIAWDYTERDECIATATMEKPFNHQVAHAENPALALCLAIEKLIDGEK